MPSALAELKKGPTEFSGRQLMRQPGEVKKEKGSIGIFTSPEQEGKRHRDKIKQLRLLLSSKFATDADKDLHGRQLYDALKEAVGRDSDTATADSVNGSVASSSSLRHEQKAGVILTQINLLGTFAACSPTADESLVTHVPAADDSGSAFAESCFTHLLVPAAVTVAPNIKTPTSPVPPAASTSLAVLDLSKETFDSFLDRMRDSEKLYFAPAKPNGSCFFEAFLLGMKSIAYCSPPYCQQPDGWKPKGIVPEWGTFDTQCMRKHVLAFMSDFVDMSFPLLADHGYSSFKDIILDEGKEYGVIDYARRDMGKGPQLFKTCAEYFKLMGEGGAYANLSCVLASCIAFNVCLKVYICKIDAPEVYGDGAVVSVCKYDRGGHYDTLMTDSRLQFLRHPPTGKDTYVYDIDSCDKHAGYGNESTCKVCKSSGIIAHESHATIHTVHNVIMRNTRGRWLDGSSQRRTHRIRRQ